SPLAETAAGSAAFLAIRGLTPADAPGSPDRAYRIERGALSPSGILVVYLRFRIRSLKSALAASSSSALRNRSTIESASTLAATSIPLGPIGEPIAATFCQLCPGLSAAKQAVESPPVATCQLMSPTSVEPRS